MTPTDRDRQLAEHIYIGWARLRADLTKNRYELKGEICCAYDTPDMHASCRALYRVVQRLEEFEYAQRSQVTGKTSTPRQFAESLRCMYCEHWKGAYCEVCAARLIAARDAEPAPKQVTPPTSGQAGQTLEIGTRPGPKFWVGQVVYAKADGEYMRIRSLGPATEIGTDEIRCFNPRWAGIEIHKRYNLRPLTAREIGLRPKRRHKETKP